MEIEVPHLCRGHAVAPGVLPFGLVLSPVCRPMPLRLGRQGLSFPTGEGAGFGMADVNRPVHRQPYLFKHGAVVPPVAVASPEAGMRDALRLEPIPRFLA